MARIKELPTTESFAGGWTVTSSAWKAYAGVTSKYLHPDAKNLGLAVFTCSGVAVLLFAAQVPTAEHALFYVADALVATFVAVYVALRCAGICGARTLVPASIALAWLLCILMSLSATGRRHQLLGLGEVDDDEACEEGSITLWLALVLTSVAVLSPMPFRVFATFGQLISLQHLIVGLILDRSECSEDSVRRGGPGGFLLGLPPIWISALQLHVLAGLLSLVNAPASEAHKFQVEALRYVRMNTARRQYTKAFSKNDVGGDSSTDTCDILVQNWMERLVEELASEEEHCRDFLREHARSDVSEWSESRAWQAVVESLLTVLSGCEQMLKEHAHTTVEKWSLRRQDVVDALVDYHTDTSEPKTAGSDVSGWLMESFVEPDLRFMKELSVTSTNCTPEDHCEVLSPSSYSRHVLKLQTTIGLGKELNVGEWSFDALKVEREKSHVLQVLGFEVLRPFSPSIMPRDALRSFLERLEASYVATNAYHSHVHGADMCNAFFFLAVHTELWSRGGFSDSIKVAILLAALGHDVGHFARNNVFLMSSRHALALRYNDRSILENFHAATLMEILQGVGPQQYEDSVSWIKDPAFFPDTKDLERERTSWLLQALSPEQLYKARQLMITLILSTDTQKHLEDIAAFRLRLGRTFNPFSNPDDQQQSLCVLFRTADIGHSAKNWVLHEEWSRRCVEEFHEQGDEEKRLGLKVSPLCDREGFVLHEAQVGFLQFVCLPTWREISRMDAMKVSERPKSQGSWSGTGSAANRHDRKMKTTDIAVVAKDEVSAKTSDTGRRSGRAKTGTGDADRFSSPPKRTSDPRGNRLCPSDQDRRSGNSPQFSNKVMPFNSPDAPSTTSLFEVTQVRRDSRHIITDCCLLLCEKNLQAWKSWAEHDKNAQDFSSRHSRGSNKSKASFESKATFESKARALPSTPERQGGSIDETRIIDISDRSIGIIDISDPSPRHAKADTC